jgi:hypothetical protein
MQRKYLCSLFILYLLPLSLLSVEVPEPETEAWFTGSLLAPTGLVIPLGRFDIEPYVLAIANTGNYSDHWNVEKVETLWNFVSKTAIEVGLGKWFDCEFIPSFSYNYTNGAAKWVINDLEGFLNFQLFHKVAKTYRDWDTGLKFYIKEVFPIGKYQHGNPSKKKTDLGGEGSWQTAAGFVWNNLFYLGSGHFLHFLLSAEYSYPLPVHVKGINFYFDSPDTNATVHPSRELTTDFAFEVTLSKHWAFSMDIYSVWSSSVHFNDQEKTPSGVQFSVAPAIEYNWSANLGIIAGAWVTVAGKNAQQFSSGVIAFNYYH